MPFSWPWNISTFAPILVRLAHCATCRSSGNFARSARACLLAADSLIRKKVNRLQAEQRQLYGTFEDAIIEFLNNHKYLWNDARTKAVLSKVDRRREDASETGDSQDKVVESAPKSSPNKERSASGSATRRSSVKPRSLKSRRIQLTKSQPQQEMRRSARTSGSQTQSGKRSCKPPAPCLAQRGVIISTPPWDALWATSAGSSISAWSAAPLTPWWAITEWVINQWLHWMR